MAKKSKKKIPFEEAIEQLETIITTMEEEQLPLESLLNHYETGNELLLHCQSLINSARQRIEVVQMNCSTETENKLASDSPKGDTHSSEAAPSDDIRLF